MFFNIEKKNLLNIFVQFAYYLLLALLAAITVYGIYELRVPLSIAVILYFLMNPMVDFLEGLGVGRAIASALALIFLLLMVVLMITYFVPLIGSEVSSILSRGDFYKAKAISILEGLKSFIQNTLPGILDAESLDIKEISSQLFSLISSFLPESSGILEGLGVVQTYVTNIIFNSIIATIALFFLLLQGSDIYIRLMELIPNRYFELTLILVHTVKKKINSYLLALAGQIIIMTTIFSVGLSIAGIPYAPILGLLAGFINIIPYLGPMIGMVPILIIAILDSGFSTPFFSALAVIGIAQLVDQVFNQPILLARAVNLNPILALIALGAFQSMLGVVGMIIGIPFTGILLVVIPVVKRNLRAFGII